jgi:hypothetical protein
MMLFVVTVSDLLIFDVLTLRLRSHLLHFYLYFWITKYMLKTCMFMDIECCMSNLHRYRSHNAIVAK